MRNESIIIYESIYNGNTKKIAQAMAQVLGCRSINSTNAMNIDLNQYKSIGFGSGIYFGCHHPLIFKVAEKLDMSEQDVFLFSSRGNPRLGKYHEQLKKLLVEKGKKLLGEFSVKGYDGTGPWSIIGGGNCGKPNERDLKKAAKFLQDHMPQYCVPDCYKQIKTRLSVKEGKVNTYTVSLGETQVVLKGDLLTFNQNDCIGCGKCVDICPLGIIDMKEGKAFSLKELDCTICQLCEKNCKERAINLHFNWRDAIKVAIRHGKRKSL
ncbi:MAG: hypothetical protein GQ564_18020 [Bacteroidales bacterium]|nr:hypothetical protein [Bacteroidales bacterium]